MACSTEKAWTGRGGHLCVAVTAFVRPWGSSGGHQCIFLQDATPSSGRYSELLAIPGLLFTSQVLNCRVDSTGFGERTFRQSSTGGGQIEDVAQHDRYLS